MAVAEATDDGWVCGVDVGAIPVGAEVAEARARLAVSIAGAAVLVVANGKVGLVDGETVIDRSHAIVAIMSMAKNNKILFIVEIPFMYNHSHHEGKTPPPLGEFLSGQVGRILFGFFFTIIYLKYLRINLIVLLK